MWTNADSEERNKPIEKSRWVIMTVSALIESNGKSFEDQQGIIADLSRRALATYEVPKVLETAVCIIAEYLGPSILFGFTRCQETVRGRNQVVIGLTEDNKQTKSLPYPSFNYFNIGVAALREL